MKEIMKEIIILGAGPVGLIAAIKLSDRYKITIYDKREMNERTRDQVVVLNRSVLKELPVSISNHPSFRYTNPGSIDQSGGIDTPSHSGNKHIQLKELEKLLFEYIKNITFIKENITNDFLENLLKTKSNSLFLVCDGFNSKTREFLKIGKIETEIGYGVVALFNNIDNEVKNYKDSVLGINQNRYRGFKSATGINHISLHLTKDEFELIHNSTKNALELPIYIQEVLQSGANFYNMSLPDLENIKIYLIPVKTFIAEEISKFKNTNLFLLLGDAANGPNFISARGVNVGIKMVRELNKIIDSYGLEELHFEYEKRVEYLLLETMDNLLNFTYDINTVEYIYKKYENCSKELDHIGKINNLDVTNLPFSEKCFVLSEIFKKGNFDVSKYKFLEERLYKRCNMIKNKCYEQKPVNLSYYC